MSLTQILQPDRIAVLHDCSDGDDLIIALSGLLADTKAQLGPIADSLRQRERLGSTAIGHGVALPHGRNDLFEQARAAFIRLSQPIAYGALDGEPVDLVLALSVPSHFTHQHLRLLAEIAERFAAPGLRDALRGAPDTATIHALLTTTAP
ncbi:PTS sugar transporter subunit IIA [Lysobacter pythonis]|uniref:PTS sugar transporter subunit IIA n=1 Tax=Solilutibacter pythonis TaxID=2483112 RepID=A0A3M2I6N9_9GAMM|nr:PTS sugar transporter subunit IIA [Lysobacter pythonis]RMH94117.1 PTS sugar transporter subunit IIA [Lysobacter pythonis]